MMQLRIGASPYLNARLLTAGLSDEPNVELVIASPARLADLLREGQLDAGLVSSTEYFNGDYLIVPGCAITAKGPGSDAVLFGNVPLARMRRIALASASRSTNLLLQLILHWDRPGEPVSYETRPEDVTRSLRELDACLVIGDYALHECGEAEYRYDLGEIWRARTGVPVVLTLWLVRPDVDPQVAQVIRRAYARGLALVEQVIEDAAVAMSLSTESVRWYLTQSLDFGWGDTHEQALLEFGRQLQALGLVRLMRELRYVEDAAVDPDASSQAT